MEKKAQPGPPLKSVNWIARHPLIRHCEIFWLESTRLIFIQQKRSVRLFALSHFVGDKTTQTNDDGFQMDFKYYYPMAMSVLFQSA